MIYKHKIYELPLYLIMSALYIVPKFLLSPFLYLAKILGLKAPFLTKLDATVNKTVLPLTEVPDNDERLDVQPKLKIGDSLPSVPLKFSDVKTVMLKDYTQTPLLVIFVRGSWCSYSRLHLADLMSNKNEFKSLGIKFLAITAYKDQEWWQSHGIDIPMYVDINGDVFKAFGVHLNNWIEYAWGRILPHESVFLFDKNGVLVFNDVRKVNSILPAQRFLGSHTLLENAHKLISN